MTTITNLSELLAEKRRLQNELQIQKLLVHEEIELIKEKIQPIAKVATFLGLFKKKEEPVSATVMIGKGILQLGASTGIELLVGHGILRKASWLTRLIVPTVLKGISGALLSLRRKKAIV